MDSHIPDTNKYLLFFPFYEDTKKGRFYISDHFIY